MIKWWASSRSRRWAQWHYADTCTHVYSDKHEGDFAQRSRQCADRTERSEEGGPKDRSDEATSQAALTATRSWRRRGRGSPRGEPPALQPPGPISVLLRDTTFTVICYISHTQKNDIEWIRMIWLYSSIPVFEIFQVESCIDFYLKITRDSSSIWSGMRPRHLRESAGLRSWLCCSLAQRLSRWINWPLCISVSSTVNGNENNTYLQCY